MNAAMIDGSPRDSTAAKLRDRGTAAINSLLNGNNGCHQYRQMTFDQTRLSSWGVAHV